jgi:hypothetical protein
MKKFTRSIVLGMTVLFASGYTPSADASYITSGDAVAAEALGPATCSYCDNAECGIQGACHLFGGPAMHVEVDCDVLVDDGCHPSSKPGTCSLHEDCEHLALNEALSDAVSRRAYASMAKLVKESSGAVVVNEARHALQVLNCSGTEVVSHIPLSENEYRRLSDLL